MTAARGSPLQPCPAENPDPQWSAVADHRAQDEEEITRLSRTEPLILPTYVDGGMNLSFRDILRRSGPQKLAALTSGKVEVSRPEAALADPFAPSASHMIDAE